MFFDVEDWTCMICFHSSFLSLDLLSGRYIHPLQCFNVIMIVSHLVLGMLGLPVQIHRFLN